ncbi:MAG: YgiQ family radical SAM protein [Bacteroidales bacterium]|uniref:YgiQ family radical SAM protein n=1 Tax=Porphyromonas sp. TaxID=1924944 RepID=UPI00297A3255|nr:YgiQ family radical SAM protein [Porphyromonas sp.]MDD7437685.1 YgiQ family radical SAM protein [Bacteroidales bacterium]MDY3067632.1 YgiQ family radical SAM protein [Porphyromonas sp.]
MSANKDLKDWLPISKKEVELRGWDELDVIIFSGDAYVDHPSFANAVIGRVLESAGYKVAIIPQPNWRDDLRDFKKLGKPRLFFGVSAGNMDSMVNHYTAAKRKRSDDAYTPDERVDMRPYYPSLVYTKILRNLFPDTPIILGGIEASLRRLTHYDYWQDKLLPGMPFMSDADIVLYGLGERSVLDIASLLDRGASLENIKQLPQIAYTVSVKEFEAKDNDIALNSHEDCLADKLCYAKNFRQIEEQSNSLNPHRLTQAVANQVIVVNPPYPLPSTEEVDRYYALPYTRLPHPRYQGKRIRAYEMIRHSINMHRGCFGGCAFCTISAHQGKFIVSRSQESIVKEAEKVTQMPDFKGYISDLGGPSANMYQMKGKNLSVCQQCLRPSCLHPKICPNLNADHTPLLEVYKKVDALPGVKKSFIGSGIRYDILTHHFKDEQLNSAAKRYTEELIKNHVSGRLKIAPEHTSPKVLQQIRKPSFDHFYTFKREFDRINNEGGLRQQLIPYFISSHPGCTEEDMADLALISKSLNFQLEQVQDFTPTPMTVATVIYYSGYHPYTLEKIHTAHTKEEKEAQRQYFFWYQPEKRAGIIKSLKRIGRSDLIDKLFGSTSKPTPNKKRRRHR